MRLTLAVIVKDGVVLSYGTNEHKEPCKRDGYPTGEGYELCRWCDYGNHAEVNAIRNATEDTSKGTLYLFGHYYACEPCKKAIQDAGLGLSVVYSGN